MKLVAVTASPAGEAHTFMAAEALRRQATLDGHELAVETQGPSGIGDPLEREVIDAADAVIVAADSHVDVARFAGKPIHAVSTAEAIRHPGAVLDAALAPLAVPAGAPGGDGGARRAVVSVIADAAPSTPVLRLVAVTSCPTGIAHTFMAAEGLRLGAEALGHEIKIETQGSVGAKNRLTDDDIARADAVIVAADTKVDLSRFAGKRLYQTGTSEALKHGATVVGRALAEAQPYGAAAAVASGRPAGAGEGGGGAESPEDEGASRGFGFFKEIYTHLMTGISHMLPFVVAGGLLIAIAFAFDIDANQASMSDTFAGRLFQIGSAALTLFLPVLAGYIAYSIADRPGIAPGFIGGYLAVQVDSGFLGALLAGFLAGYVTRELARRLRLPAVLEGLRPILILPLLGSLLVGLGVFYVIGEPISWLQDQTTDWLTGLQGTNAALLGLILGVMMASDMGGPFNKVAYTFAVGLLNSGVTDPMAAVMVAGMVPPLGLAVATVVFPGRFTHDEREAGKPAFVLGLAFITEGAIPFAARDPLHVIPAVVAGSATAGAISMGLGASTVVPHGGIFDLLAPGAVQGVAQWLVALVAGTLVTVGVLYFTKRPLRELEGRAVVEAASAPA